MKFSMEVGSFEESFGSFFVSSGDVRDELMMY